MLVLTLGSLENLEISEFILKPEGLRVFDDHLRALEEVMPKEGGFLCVFQAPGPEEVIAIDGDRTALIRFAMLILRYAVDARLKEGRYKCEAKEIIDLFPPPSQTRGVFIQCREKLDETKRPGQSILRFVWDKLT